MTKNIRESVYVLVRNSQGKYLMQLRDNKPEVVEGGKWNFPGGGVEPGENPFEAGVRELEEEIGVRVLRAEIEHIGVLNHLDNRDENDRLDPYKVHILRLNTDVNEDECTSGEGERLEYFRKTELSDLDLMKSSQEVLTRFI